MTTENASRRFFFMLSKSHNKKNFGYIERVRRLAFIYSSHRFCLLCIHRDTDCTPHSTISNTYSSATAFNQCRRFLCNKQSNLIICFHRICLYQYITVFFVPFLFLQCVHCVVRLNKFDIVLKYLELSEFLPPLTTLNR